MPGIVLFFICTISLAFHNKPRRQILSSLLFLKREKWDIERWSHAQDNTAWNTEVQKGSQPVSWASVLCVTTTPKDLSLLWLQRFIKYPNMWETEWEVSFQIFSVRLEQFSPSTPENIHIDIYQLGNSDLSTSRVSESDIKWRSRVLRRYFFHISITAQRDLF